MLCDINLFPSPKGYIPYNPGLKEMHSSCGCVVLQGAANNYETDLILPLVHATAELAGIDYATADERQTAGLKVVADHARAVTYLISDGVTPSNVGRGYVLRRLLRRAVMKVTALRDLGLGLRAKGLRAVTYLISDGVTPSNVGRGYVLRRLLRRAVMKVKKPRTTSVPANARLIR